MDGLSFAPEEEGVPDERLIEGRARLASITRRMPEEACKRSKTSTEQTTGNTSSNTTPYVMCINVPVAIKLEPNNKQR